MKSIYMEIAKDLFKEMEIKPLRFQPIINCSVGFEQEPTAEETLAELIDKEKEELQDTSGLEPFSTGYTRSFTSFCGADVVVSINNEDVGEFTDMKYFKIDSMLANILSGGSNYCDRYFIEEYPVVLAAKTVLFDKEIEIPDDADITLKFANEYGDRSVQKFSGVKVLSQSSGISVDSVTMEKKIIMIAKSMTPLAKVE